VLTLGGSDGNGNTDYVWRSTDRGESWVKLVSRLQGTCKLNSAAVTESGVIVVSGCLFEFNSQF